MTGIKRALTNEQWTRREVEFGAKGWAHIDGVFPVREEGGEFIHGESVVPLGEMYVGTYKLGVASGFGIPLKPRMRHALAALCLDGQRFGFTNQDVHVLRGLAAEHPGTEGPYPLGKYLNALADRIQALLPTTGGDSDVR